MKAYLFMNNGIKNTLITAIAIGVIFSVTQLLNSCSDSAATSLPKKIDFNFHVRPILSDKCFACHGPDENKRKADLRLDTEEGALAALGENGDYHAVVPGKPKKSEVYRRIMEDDTTEVMPPPASNLELSEREKIIIGKWIEQGAEYKPHWSFVLPEKPEIPIIENEKFQGWANNEIDHFILNKLGEIGLTPNNQADKERLLKRVAMDLTGLPPDIEMQDRFLKDESPDAYEKVVDELLGSPHFGEKIGVHWLDVARYADSHGYQDDGLRTMWPWRDWVIHALNNNYPYDKFVTWQLAGDLLPEKTKETLLATGFNRNHKITQEGGVIDEEYRIEYVTDRTNTFGKAFLGMTFECAKCHDHKYDPISQRDYFGTFAFFDKVPEKGIFGTIDASFADPPNMAITNEDIERELPFINKKDSTPVEVMVMKDSAGIRETHLLNRGAYDAKAEVVDYQLPEEILPFDTTKFEKNRLGLSKWLFDENNPLTARVFVNRMWQEIYGNGLVKTSGDFGLQGDFPTHPELLDWLAKDFRNSGWDIKNLLKKIVMSATYRQSSVVDENKLAVDPENVYYSRQNRARVTAEMLRDHVLASSGLLNREIGGPSVKPYQPEGLWDAATSGRGLLKRYIPDTGDDLYRRGMYTFIKRTVPPPSMLMFDASNRDQCEVRRLETSTPLQALIMLNDPHVLEASRVLTEKLLEDESTTLDKKFEIAFRKIVCRYPKEKEIVVLSSYYKEVLEDFKSDPESAKGFVDVGEYPQNENIETIDKAALMQIVHTIYNMEEAITKS